MHSEHCIVYATADVSCVSGCPMYVSSVLSQTPSTQPTLGKPICGCQTKQTYQQADL